MNGTNKHFDLVRPQLRHTGLMSWKAWVFAAALGGVGLSVETTRADWPGRTPLRTSAKTSSTAKTPSSRNGFQETVERLMMESRMYSERGDHDRAVQLADRAAKISDASRDMLGSAPHCSPAETARFAREVRMKRDQVAGRSKLPLQQYGFTEGTNNETVRTQSSQSSMSAAPQSLVSIEERIQTTRAARVETVPQSRPAVSKSREPSDFASTIPSHSLNDSIPSDSLFDLVPGPEPELPPSPVASDLDLIESVVSTPPTRRVQEQVAPAQTDDHDNLFAEEGDKSPSGYRVTTSRSETVPATSFEFVDEESFVDELDERSDLFPANDSANDAPVKLVPVVATAPGKPIVRFVADRSSAEPASGHRHLRTGVTQLDNANVSTETWDGSTHFGIRLVSDSQLDQQEVLTTESFPVQRVRELKRRLESAASLDPGVPYTRPRQSLVTSDIGLSSEPVPLKRSLPDQDLVEESVTPRFVIPSESDSESSLDMSEPVISSLIDEEGPVDNRTSSTSDLLLDFRPDEESEPAKAASSRRNIRSEDVVFEQPHDGSDLPARTEIEFAPSMAERTPATQRPSRNVVVARSTIRTINSSRSIVPILSDDSGWKSVSDYTQEVAARNNQLVESQQDTKSPTAVTEDPSLEAKADDAGQQTSDDSVEAQETQPRWLNLRGGRVELRKRDVRQPNVSNESLSISTWGHGAAKSRVELWRSADGSERSEVTNSNSTDDVDLLKNPATPVAWDSESDNSTQPSTQPEFENDTRMTRGVKPAPPPPVESSSTITQLGFRKDAGQVASDDLPLIVEGPSLGETTSLKKAKLEKVALSGSVALGADQDAGTDWSIHDSAHADKTAESVDVNDKDQTRGIVMISKSLSAATEKAGSLLGFAGLGLMLAGLFLYRLALRNHH